METSDSSFAPFRSVVEWMIGSSRTAATPAGEPCHSSLPISQNGVDKDGFGSPQLVDANSMLEARIGEEGPGGKAWFEIESPQRTREQLLSSYVAALGVKHLVQGHQHQKIVFEDGQQRSAGQMFQWRGLLFLIDVGMSRRRRR